MEVKVNTGEKEVIVIIIKKFIVGILGIQSLRSMYVGKGVALESESYGMN